MSDYIKIRKSREEDNLDSTFEILRFLTEIDHRRREYEMNHAKYKIGQRVRVVNDVDRLTEYFRSLNDNYRESVIQARNLAGRVLKVMNSEELINNNGEKGKYVNLEDEQGYFYLLAEDLVKDLGAR